MCDTESGGPKVSSAGAPSERIRDTAWTAPFFAAVENKIGVSWSLGLLVH